MRDLIKKHLNEAKKPLVGCDFFEDHTSDHRWCKYAENKLMKNTRRIKNAMYDYTKEFLSTYETGLRAVKYNKELQFFSERRDMVIDALEKFNESCPKLRKYVIESMKRFTEHYVIWDEKQQYDLLNKLTTNYTAAAYMLTANLPDYYKTSVSFNNVLKYFFDDKNDDGLTPFEVFMGKIASENKREIRERINQTITQKTKDGQEIEDRFYEYITEQLGGSDVITYSGDYSFMDMIGIDLMVKNPENKWVPIQVKKYAGGCDDNTIKLARNHMCENWCVSNEAKFWNIRVYNGPNLIKIKKQCKTSELDQTTFLNVHGTPNKESQSGFCRADYEDEEEYYDEYYKSLENPK